MKSQFRIMAVVIAALASGTTLSAIANDMTTTVPAADGAQGAGGQVGR